MSITCWAREWNAWSLFSSAMCVCECLWKKKIMGKRAVERVFPTRNWLLANLGTRNGELISFPGSWSTASLVYFTYLSNWIYQDVSITIKIFLFFLKKIGMHFRPRMFKSNTLMFLLLPLFFSNFFPDVFLNPLMLLPWCLNYIALMFELYCPDVWTILPWCLNYIALMFFNSSQKTYSSIWKVTLMPERWNESTCNCPVWSKNLHANILWGLL